MDNTRTTPKDFFMWAGAMVAFYWSVVAFIFLIWDYINFVYPDPLAYYPADPYQTGISQEMASIIVLVPLYLVLVWAIQRAEIADPSRRQIWVRRWAILLTLFVSGATMAVDLIWLLTSYLNGETLTLAFILKAKLIFLVALLTFLHFISDLRGYWERYPARRRVVGIAAAAVAFLAVIAGFFIVGTPAEARLYRYDAQKVSDLQNIQSQVIGYWQAKRTLPRAISDLNSSLMYGPVPSDPQTGSAYEYRATGALSFELCADFNKASRGREGGGSWEGRAYPMPVDTSFAPKGLQPDNWTHGAARHCYARTIDPSFYPPLR